MAIITNRTDFKNYCLRKLGSPVVQINVADEQVEDRIDDAFAYYQDYHYDATEQVYLKHQVTADDIANKWIPVADNVIGIRRVIPVQYDANSTNNIFDVRYQMFLNDIYNLSSTEMLTYELTRSHMQLVSDMIQSQMPVRFSRHQNKLFIDSDWEIYIPEGKYLIIQAQQVLNPDEYTDVWNDRWLKRYATSLIKKQWGENLSKYEGIQMPGGVTFNGARLVQEAQEEINKLEEEMSLRYELPVDFMIG